MDSFGLLYTSEMREAKIRVNSCNSWLLSSSFERSEMREALSTLQTFHFKV
ncbi:MAG: hypothetical protein GX793_06055 [Bacteroidales bacterium]|nr:hypothetical protein [Bacteroidales bacterium]NLB86605.1 hypothetical protein [Bacteroidales bacterium]